MRQRCLPRRAPTRRIAYTRRAPRRRREFGVAREARRRVGDGWKRARRKAALKATARTVCSQIGAGSTVGGMSLASLSMVHGTWSMVTMDYGPLTRTRTRNEPDN